MDKLEHKVHYRKNGKILWCERWYLNTNRHRTDGPAEVYYGLDGKTIESEIWRLNDRLLELMDQQLFTMI